MTTYNSQSVLNNNNNNSYYAAYFPLQLYESNSTSNFYPARRRQMSGNTRTRQLLLANQSVLNNLVSLNSLNPSTNRSSHDIAASETHRSSNSSKSFLIKKPFKHYHQSSESIKSSNKDQSKTDSEKSEAPSTNPSIPLILSTAKDVNQFVDAYERERLLNQVEMSNRRVSYLRKPPNSSKYSGLKPLDYQGPVQGPNIQNCIGIKNEPKGKKGSEIRELYEYKLKLLKMKYNGRDILNNELNEDRAISRSLSTPNQNY